MEDTFQDLEDTSDLISLANSTINQPINDNNDRQVFIGNDDAKNFKVNISLYNISEIECVNEEVDNNTQNTINNNSLDNKGNNNSQGETNVDSNSIHGESSGVYSCSSDISDLCMADVTDLTAEELALARSISELQTLSDDADASINQLHGSNREHQESSKVKESDGGSLNFSTSDVSALIDSRSGQRIDLINDSDVSALIDSRSGQRIGLINDSDVSALIDSRSGQRIDLINDSDVSALIDSRSGQRIDLINDSNDSGTHEIHWSNDDEIFDRDLIKYLKNQLIALQNQMLLEEEINRNAYEEREAMFNGEISILKSEINNKTKLLDNLTVVTDNLKKELNCYNETFRQIKDNDEKLDLDLCKKTIANYNKFISTLKDPENVTCIDIDSKDFCCNSGEAVDLEEELNNFTANMKYLLNTCLNYYKMVSDLNTMIGDNPFNDSLKSFEILINELYLKNDQLTSDYDKLYFDYNNLQGVLQSKEIVCEERTNMFNEINKSCNAIKSENDRLHYSNSLLKLELDKYREIEENSLKMQLELDLLREKYKSLDHEHSTKCKHLSSTNELLLKDKLNLENELMTLTDSFNKETERCKQFDLQFANWQTMFETLNKKIQENESYFIQVKMNNTHLKSQLNQKEENEKYFFSSLNNLLSVDEHLSKFQLYDKSRSSFDKGFEMLRKRLIDVYDLCKKLEKETNKTKSLETNCNLLDNVIAQKDKEIQLLVKDYSEQLDYHKQSFSKLAEQNKLLNIENSELRKINRELNEQMHNQSNHEMMIQTGIYDDLKNRIQELKLDLVDRESKISSLELHIESCCSYYREKAQDYKQEVSELRSQLRNINRNQVYTTPPNRVQLDCQQPKVQKFETGIQTDNSLPRGIIERHKVKELEDKILKLEKDKIILSRLCNKRAETIKFLRSKLPP